MKRIILALFGGIVALPAAAYPWEGIWAYDPATCGKTGSFSLTATAMTSTIQSCRLHDIVPLGGLAAWQQMTRCKTEAGWADLPRLMLLESPDALWIWAGSGAPLRYQRCPAE